MDERVPPRTGQLINEYTWGGYLAWRLGPKFKVLLDGRTNMFDAAFWQVTYLSTPEECARFLSAIDADAAILPRDGSRFRPALESSGWTVAHDDGRAVVMLPRATKR